MSLFIPSWDPVQGGFPITFINGLKGIEFDLYALCAAQPLYSLVLEENVLYRNIYLNIWAVSVLLWCYIPICVCVVIQVCPCSCDHIPWVIGRWHWDCPVEQMMLPVGLAVGLGTEGLCPGLQSCSLGVTCR